MGERQPDDDGRRSVAGLRRAGSRAGQDRQDLGQGRQVDPGGARPRAQAQLAADPVADRPAQLGDAALGDDPAVLDERQPAAQRLGLGHRVGGQDDGPSRARPTMCSATNSRMATAEIGSSERVGSSMNRISGSLIRPRAMASFWRWPVDRWPNGRSRWSADAEPLGQVGDPRPVTAALGRCWSAAKNSRFWRPGQPPVERALVAADQADPRAHRARVAGDVEAGHAGDAARSGAAGSSASG